MKTGSGAFMKSMEDSVHLAELLVETGTRMHKRVVALITDMDQPLGRAVGNSLEVIESIEVLAGGGPPDLRELSVELSAWMFYLGERVSSVEEGKRLAAEQIETGRAVDKFREIIHLQGGDPMIVDHPDRLPLAGSRVDVMSPRPVLYVRWHVNNWVPRVWSWAEVAHGKKTPSILRSG